MKKKETIKGVRINKPFHKHRVYINGKQISWKKSMEYTKMSKTGFEWGYRGAGPHQLAFAILLELTNEAVAYSLCSAFTEQFVAKLPKTENFEVPLKGALHIIELCSKNPAAPFYIPHAEKHPEKQLPQ